MKGNLEQEAAGVAAKHRAAVEEVAARDAAILDLQRKIAGAGRGLAGVGGGLARGRVLARGGGVAGRGAHASA